MTSKREAQRQARGLRKKVRNRTVNVVEVSSRNWGVRFSPKGRRDTFDYRPSGRSRFSRGFSESRRFNGNLYHLAGPARHRTVPKARKEARRLRKDGFPARVVKRKGGGASVYVMYAGENIRRRRRR